MKYITLIFFIIGCSAVTERDLLEQSKKYYSDKPNILTYFSFTSPYQNISTHLGYGFWLNKKLYFPVHLLDLIPEGREGSIHYDMLVYNESFHPISTKAAILNESFIFKGNFPESVTDKFSVPLLEWTTPLRMKVVNGRVFEECWFFEKWHSNINGVPGTSGFPYIFYLSDPKIWIHRNNKQDGESGPLLGEDETSLIRIKTENFYPYKNYKKEIPSCSFTKILQESFGRYNLTDIEFLQSLTQKNYIGW